MSHDDLSHSQIHRALRQSSGWFNLNGESLLWGVSGADAQRYLQGQLTNDVTLATADRALRAFLCSAKGMIEAMVFVHRAPTGDFRVSAAEARGEEILLRLEKYLIADDVEITDLSEDSALFHVLGPDARKTVDALDIADLQVVQTARYRMTGFDLIAPGAAGEALRQQLAELAPEVPSAVRQVLRVEQGVPNWENEFSEGVLPAETGLLNETVHFSSGCYVGQEVISRMKSSGKVRRHLVGLEVTQGNGLRAGLELYEPGAEGGKPLGKITSLVERLGDPKTGEKGALLALGYVKDGFAAPGQSLTACGPGDSQDRRFVSVQVVKLPFIKELFDR